MVNPISELFKRPCFLTFFSFVLLTNAVGQSIPVQKRLIASDQATQFHYQFNGDPVHWNDAITTIRNTFNLNSDYHLEEIASTSGVLGGEHLRWQVLLQGKPVVGSVVIGHFEGGTLRSANGILYHVNPSDPLISKEDAVAKAKLVIPSQLYAWEDDGFAAQLNAGEKLLPKPKLMYCPQNMDFENPLALCYRVRIYSIEPLAHQLVYIHAGTGETWASEDLIHETDAKGSANTKYRGVKSIVADSFGSNLFRLREAGRGGGIETFDMNQGRKYSAAVDFIDSNNYWDNYNALFDEVAGDAHFGAEQTYDYFKNKFNRNSFDGNGAKIRSFIHYGSKYVNAFWNGFAMTYGDGNGSTISPLTTVDICGHEIAHAVTTNSAALIYRNESGALNESFSDIFGNAVEWYADSTQFSWRMGEDIMANKNGIRNMANPKTHRDPSTYKGQYWYSGTGDNGGVHTNSGVQNYWFYLLCNGSSGVNDNQDSFFVDSLGIIKAEQIAYRNLTVYLTNSSDYEEARYYGIQSAADLYGYCSKEVEATTNAWYAVGVGDPYDSSAVKADFTADSTYCQGSEEVRFINNSQNAKSFLWTFGDGDSSQFTHPTHRYNRQGEFTVGLIVESCYNGFMDTLVRTNFISIDSSRDICNGILLPYGTWDTVRACTGFIYDHAGESDYTGLHRDTLTLDFSTSDSAVLTFLEFDYETNYDSIYMFDGYSPDTASLVGGFTGKYLPNNGNPISFYSGAITLVHFSDPFVVGTGFKAKFEAKRPALSFAHTPDTTVCFGTSVNLVMKGSGGNSTDHYYSWNSSRFSNTFQFKAEQDTFFTAVFGDLCMREFLADTITVKVRDSVSFSQSGDPLICQGNSAIVWVNPSGGTEEFDFAYSTGGGTTKKGSANLQLSGLTPGEHSIWIALTDNCTPGVDTAFYSIRVRDSLALSLTNDTTICMGTFLDLHAQALGGDGDYLFTWENGTTGNRRVVYPGSNQRYAVRLTDGCSSFSPEDSVMVSVLDSLKMVVSGPELVCFGEEAQLSAVVSGGKEAERKITWENYPGKGETWTKEVRENEQFKATLTDKCSASPAVDSTTVLVRTPLTLSISEDQAMCHYDTVNISVKASGGIVPQHTVSWSAGLTNGYQHRVSPSFTKTYLATLRDGCSDSATAFTTVMVRDLSIPDFSVSEADICLGESIELVNTGSTGMVFTHEWRISNGLTLAGSLVSFTPGKSGWYNVELITTDGYGCDYAKEKLNAFQVWDYPIAKFGISRDTLFFNDQELEVVNESTLGNGFSWYVEDEWYSSEKDPLVEFELVNNSLVTKTGKIMLIVKNEIGCADTSVRTIPILGRSGMFFASAFSPNGDGINDTYGPVTTNYKEVEFWIINRHGLIVFESNSMADRWNGKSKGEKVPQGMYQVFIKGVDIYNQPIEESGTLTVVY